jgi:hypothetical protein
MRIKKLHFVQFSPASSYTKFYFLILLILYIILEMFMIYVPDATCSIFRGSSVIAISEKTE